MIKFTVESLIGFPRGYSVWQKFYYCDPKDIYVFYAQKPEQSFLVKYVYFSNCGLSTLERWLPFSLGRITFVTVRAPPKIVCANWLTTYSDNSFQWKACPVAYSENNVAFLSLFLFLPFFSLFHFFFLFNLFFIFQRVVLFNLQCIQTANYFHRERENRRSPVVVW